MATTTTIGGAPVTGAHYARYSASLVSGLLTSLIGAVVMLAVLSILFMVGKHTSLFYPLRPIGTLVYGDRMLSAPTPAMYAGALALHFGVCAVWGILFAFFASVLGVERSVGGSLVLGVVIGLAAEIIDVNMMVPALTNLWWGSDLWTRVVPPLYSWLANIAFGLTFGVAPLIFRRLWLRWSAA